MPACALAARGADRDVRTHGCMALLALLLLLLLLPTAAAYCSFSTRESFIMLAFDVAQCVMNMKGVDYPCAVCASSARVACKFTDGVVS